jgi:hypothetical protein
MTTDTVCGRFAGEPKHRQWLDALLLTLGSCKSRQKSCHEEEGGEAKGMTGSKLLRRPLAGSVLRNEAYCLAWRDFLHRRLMTNTALPAMGVGQVCVLAVGTGAALSACPTFGGMAGYFFFCLKPISSLGSSCSFTNSFR